MSRIAGFVRVTLADGIAKAREAIAATELMVDRMDGHPQADEYDRRAIAGARSDIARIRAALDGRSTSTGV